VETPPNLLEREALFAHNVALALGLPGGVMLKVISLCTPSLSRIISHAHTALICREDKQCSEAAKGAAGQRVQRCMGALWWIAA
jgi:hypothetical protein